MTVRHIPVDPLGPAGLAVHVDRQPNSNLRRPALNRSIKLVDYNVYRNGDNWIAKRPDASRASVVADTQRAAYDAARDLSSRNGGGEISVHGLDGQIRDKNTISPAKDPRSSKG